MATANIIAIALLATGVGACSQQAPADNAADTQPSAAATQAMAETPSGAEVIAQQDTNSHGAVSRAEYTAMTDARFANVDADGDGRLTGSERSNYHGKPGPEQTREEYLEASLGVFESEDTNKDGTIAGDEIGRLRDHIDGGSKPLAQTKD